MPDTGSAVNHTLELGGSHLTLFDVARLARGELSIRVADRYWKQIDASELMVQAAWSGEDPVYGVTTGFGALSDVMISPEAGRDLQINLLRSHASGTGAPLSDEVVRLMLALRIHALARGYSGVSRQLLNTLVDMYNANIVPVVPAQGSVGASGDLAPLAHLALPVTGEGYVRVNGATTDAGQALRKAGISPITLQPKEALALINGTQAMTAIGALAHLQARRVLQAAICSGALVVVALGGRVASFDPLIHQVRPHPGQITVASMIRHLLNGWQGNPEAGRPVQDRYSLRALPQVLGAILDTFEFTRKVLETEVNSVTDNPLFFPEEDRVINGANFHGHPVALACDHLKTAITSLTTFSERRVASLVDPRSSGLPAFLAKEPGLNSGLMIAHYVAASLVSENRLLASPASVDSISTSADVEDYNSMGMHAARNLAAVVENASRVVAIELICAAQAIDLQGLDLEPAPVAPVFRQIRDRVPFLERDEFGVGGWIDDLSAEIREGRLSLPDLDRSVGTE